MPADHPDDTVDSTHSADPIDADDADQPEEIDDIKAKMRAALESKQANDRGTGGGRRKGGKAPETHGPLGGVHMHRRKAGGGGS